MNKKLYEIVKEATQRGIQTDACWDHVNSQLVFKVHGFSKDGTVTLSESAMDDDVTVSQRYGGVESINTFRELAAIAWGSFLDYKDRETFSSPDSQWTSTFIELGWLEEVVETKTVLRIKK